MVRKTLLAFIVLAGMAGGGYVAAALTAQPAAACGGNSC